MRILFIIFLAVACNNVTTKSSSFSFSNYEKDKLELIKTSKLEAYYLHHVKKSKDTLLIISMTKRSNDEFKVVDFSKLSKIEFLPLKTDTLYFTYDTRVAGKPYKIKTTSAPMGKVCKTLNSYSYSALFWE